MGFRRIFTMDLALMSLNYAFMHVLLCFYAYRTDLCGWCSCAGTSDRRGHNDFFAHLVPKNVVFKLFSDMNQEKMAELPFGSLKGMRGSRF